MIKIFRQIDRGIEKFSHVALVVAIFLMLGFSIFGIVLRWFHMSFLWIDPLVRHLVFASAFLGGVIATGKKSHIAIDIVSKFLQGSDREGSRRNLERVIYLTCVFALVWLVYAAYGFLQVEIQYGKYGSLGVHSSVLVGIIPVGFSLIAYRFFYLLLDSVFASTTAKDAT